MKKEEVELIIIGVNTGKEDILNIKIYKDGTIYRTGCGGMPTFNISGITMEGDKKYWNELFPLIDPAIVENPINYQEEKIVTPLEYHLVFFGASSNGQTGERATWTKNSGVRFLVDINTSYKNPLLAFLDHFSNKAAEITNEWFFDIVIWGLYKYKPLNLENTFVSVPKTLEERQEAHIRYFNLMVANSSIGWDIVAIGNGRNYKTNDGIEVTSKIEKNAKGISINFFQTVKNYAAEGMSLNEFLELDEKIERHNQKNTQTQEVQSNNSSNSKKEVSNNSNTQNAAKLIEDAKNKMRNAPLSPKYIPAKKWWQFWK